MGSARSSDVHRIPCPLACGATENYISLLFYIRMQKIDFSKIYSYSKLELFKKCKKQYHFSYLDPEIAPIKKQFYKPRDYKTKGNAVHGAITLFYHLPKKKRTFEGIKKCLEKAWFSEADATKAPPLGKLGGFLDLEHERRVYGDSLRQLNNLLKIEKNPSLFYMPTENIWESFSDYEEMIKPLDEGVMISGKFDRIDRLEDGSLRIIDFKTGKENGSFFQLEFYKILTEMNFSDKVSQVSFYYLDSGKVKNFDADKIDSSEIKNRILEKIDVVNKTEKFFPTQTRLCDHCDFQEICPAFAKTSSFAKSSADKLAEKAYF